ncbi:4Fe-4S binding protein [Arabiibacter massiliensis]|uniref:4Fe-4S binding protein n=1 Tax=Arabiibacter massiliensis TaxID=1870985 RepID=UPI001E434977|nr:4Fe-4S binding protein [Arabiibacter massiliensis]
MSTTTTALDDSMDTAPEPNGKAPSCDAASGEHAAVAGERPLKKPLVRRLVVAGVFLAACAGIVFNLGVGTISSFGWESLAAICPLGGLETMLAGKLFIPRALVFLLLVVAVGAVLGKVFCSWVCPVPGVRSLIDALAHRSPRIATGKAKGEDGAETAEFKVVRPLTRREKRALAKAAGGDGACASSCSSCAACGPRELCARLDSRHLVLGGSLLSAAVFGFPVFCLVCPIGLTFASIIALVQLFGLQTLSWGAVLFPLILVLELTVLRKWCGRFCPLGALMSLASLPNRLLRPRVDAKKCLRGKGVDCRICADACPEGLDPHVAEGMHECSKCRDCAVNCPAGAITFPLRRR